MQQNPKLLLHANFNGDFETKKADLMENKDKDDGAVIKKRARQIRTQIRHSIKHAKNLESKASDRVMGIDNEALNNAQQLLSKIPHPIEPFLDQLDKLLSPR